VAKFDGIAEIDELVTVKSEIDGNKSVDVVISRTSEIKLVDEKSGNVLSTNNIPYGSQIFIKSGDKLSKGDLICHWYTFNGVIILEFVWKSVYEEIDRRSSYQVEIDEETGFNEKVISESKNKKLIPTLHIQDTKGNILRPYNLPVGAHIMVDDGEKIKSG